MFYSKKLDKNGNVVRLDKSTQEVEDGIEIPSEEYESLVKNSMLQIIDFDDFEIVEDGEDN
jgi:hypothetical protein